MTPAVKLLEKAHDTYDDVQGIYIGEYVDNFEYCIEGKIYNDKTVISKCYDLPEHTSIESVFHGEVTVLDMDGEEIYTDELTLNL